MAVELRPTECITFPRSGHHLLHRLLDRYFEDGALVYCEPYGDSSGMIGVDPATTFQKNHDLELATPIRDDRQYLVQIRYPVESIVSWYLLACEKRDLPDTPAAWTGFAIQKASFWMRFYRKWVLESVPGRLVVNYADLVGDTVATVERVIRFLGDPAPDRDRLRFSCEQERVARRRNVMDFKYYGPDFFSMLRGLFAAVPGVDLDREELHVPGGESDPLPTALAPAIHKLRVTGRELQWVIDLLNDIQAAEPAPGVPAPRAEFVG